MQVHLLSPSIWQPLMEAALLALDVQERRLAQALLATFHNRHVGITPELVATLAPVLLDPALQTRAPRPWDAVIGRLLDELLATEGASSSAATLRPRQRFGLLLSANPSYSALRIILPVVLAACRQLEQCCLFCADEVPATVTAAAYTEYADQLSHDIGQLALQRDDPFQLFWRERSITLSSLSRQTGRAGAAAATLPEMDPAALRLLLQLAPAISTTQQAKKLPRLVTPLKRQRSQTRKEGGVDGIRVTRRMDDLNNILMSEFINPPLLLADRILNTGYLAIERPPERVKLRDVLIAALMPADVQQGLTGDFVKACWFDCLMQLSVLLRHHKLHQSEFRWIEGDRFDRARSEVYLLDQMPTFDVEMEEEANAGYRDEFLKALRWLPSYLDTRAPFQPLARLLGEPTLAVDDTASSGQTSPRDDQLRHWFAAAWESQTESRVWQNRQAVHTRQRQRYKDQLAVDEFAYVHVMLLLPASERTGQLQDFSARSGQLTRLLKLDRGPHQHVSITWAPDRLAPLPSADQLTRSNGAERTPSPPVASGDDRSQEWLFEAKGEPAPIVIGNALVEPTGKDLAGAVEKVWLQQLLKEMWRG
jgi:hypothetical protein